MESRANTMNTTSSDNMRTPLLYPCANRVKIPQVGADETNFKPRRSFKAERTFLRAASLPPNVKKEYLKRISTGLSFSEDVVKERCFHLLPYSDKYFYEALDYTELIPTPPKAHITPGRHNMRGQDKRHLPCHIKKRSNHQLKPIKRRILERAADIQKKSTDDTAEKKDLAKGKESCEPFFLTEAGPLVAESAENTPATPSKPDGMQQKEWDAYLMSILSKSTAQWIVKSHMSPDNHRAELDKILTARYGPMDDDNVELIKDNISELDFDTKPNTTGQKWKKREDTLLDKVREATLLSQKPTDPYSDDSNAAFYRLPAGFRRAKKLQKKEKQGAINQTAHNVHVRPFEAPPPPTLRDYVNPAVSSTLYDTDNMFVQEWLTGAQQVYQKSESTEKIVLDTNNKYKKILQKESPRDPDVWYSMPGKEKENHDPDNTTVKKFERGLHRWKELPEPIDPGSGVMKPPMEGDFLFMKQDTAEKCKLMPPGVDPRQEKAQELAVKRPIKPNHALVTIVSDWRSRWHLDMRYADAGPEDLIRDMADLHPHIRLKAIATCARAAEFKPPNEPGVVINSETSKQYDPSSDHQEANKLKPKVKPEYSVEHVKLLPQKLFIALECCLEDENEQVRRAAAIALYTLEKPTDKAEEILRGCLAEGQTNDRWTAAQCLAYYGECDSEVVGELIKQLLNTEDILRFQQAGTLLADLSDNSTLVHSMIAEQMNSSSWRHRVMACKVVPRLKGNINRDMVNKLCNLMWNDWHTEVRKSAAQTLGKTGHGKDVHDELNIRITKGNERTRVEGVSKVGHLGIMTAKLLPTFLECFEDSYVSVRQEVCVACTNLAIKEPAVLNKLVYLATYDPIWKVKALALQALGAIGAIDPAIRECVTWAFRYEDQPGVRAQACHALIQMQLKDQDVAQMLQDRYLVETSDIVKEQITMALAMFDISPTEDMDMVAQIKNEVRKLCTRNNICAQITTNEQEDDKLANHKRMIHMPPEELKKETERCSARKLLRPVSQASQSSGASRPQIIVTGDQARSYSRETSILTPTVDKEIQMVMAKYDQGTSTPGADSRSGSAKTRRTLDDSILEGEEDVFSDDGSAPSGEKSFLSTKSAANTNNSGSSKPASALKLSEKQTYVEITDKGHSGDSDDVVMVRYKSPGEGSQAELSTSPIGILKKTMDSGPLSDGIDPDHSQASCGVAKSEKGDSNAGEETSNQELTVDVINTPVSSGKADMDNLQHKPSDTKEEISLTPASTLSPASGGSKHPLALENDSPMNTSENQMSFSADMSNPDQLLGADQDDETADQDKTGQLEDKQWLEREGFAADGFSSEDDSS